MIGSTEIRTRKLGKNEFYDDESARILVYTNVHIEQVMDKIEVVILYNGYSVTGKKEKRRQL